MKISSISPPCLLKFRPLLVIGAVFSSVLPGCVFACWGRSAPKFGDMTKDYDLLVGNELVLNCTLNSHEIEVDRKKYYVNSSHLSFRKGSKFPPAFVHIVDELTAQLRLPNATREDAGFYYCELDSPDLSKEPVVCSSKVSVGYPPGEITNFKCLSKYYENLTCTWDVPDNGVLTKYTLYKHFFLSRFLNQPEVQQCPSGTLNNSYCQWRRDTDPPFDVGEEKLTFEVHGNNSLGTSKQQFTLIHYEIFVPNSPQTLTAIEIDKQNVTLEWTVPLKMEKKERKPPLRYVIIVEELDVENPARMVYDAGIDTFSYVVTGLIPHITYNFSLKCRSEFASAFGMWSPLISIQKRTLSDVPYKLPEIIPEAYELRNYDEYQTISLYWKPVERKHYNGENFKYYIEYNKSSLENEVSSVKSASLTAVSATFSLPHINMSYTFRLFSSNIEGLSHSYQTVFLDREDNLPRAPKDITVISHSPGRYEISWKPAEPVAASSAVSYAVFWCSSVKPWQSRCDEPIQWLDTYVHETKVVLNLSDAGTNFQFAVSARTATASSGMQWASCIVPYKSALNKIDNVFLMSENSSSIRVVWKLHCDAQREVIKKYEIVYCKVNRDNQCAGPKLSTFVTNPSQQQYVLQKLDPYSNYSVVVRAYNLEGLRNEDSDPKFLITMEGTPSEPWDVKVFTRPNATLHVKWRPPLHPNGIVTQYVLQYGTREEIIKVDAYSDVYEADIEDLLFFKNYSIVIKACVQHMCSSSLPAFGKTDIGVPGYMDPPRIEDVNSTFIRVLWNRPLMPNGPIDFYEVHWREMKNWTNAETGVKVVRDGLSTVIEIKCSSIEDGGLKYLFSVRAVNRKDGYLLYGPISSDTQATACSLPEGLAMIIGAAIGGTLLLAVVMLVIYKVIRWMSDKIHQVKNITVRLPKGLDGLENNPLNNYGDFKNGLLNQNTHTSSIGRLSYVIDEADNKNRHGSGSSQYSYSSTDELLYRNGKCTKFSRKPSVESSGCSSMSSNVTKVHPSSESSAESDFMTPPSPDLVFADQSSHKNTLPVVIEAQDSIEESSKKLAIPFTEEDLYAHMNGDDLQDQAFGNNHPYSKFGLSGYTSSSPSPWMNSLAYYSRNLSNSEPSVMDANQLTPYCPPYSKIGLAKSSGDIIGLRPDGVESGYSRFSVIPKCTYENPQPTCNPVCVANVQVPNSVSILPSKLAFGKNVNIEDPLSYGLDFNPCNSAFDDGKYSKNPRKVIPRAKDMRAGYVRFGRADQGFGCTKSGYVPFNEVKVLGQSAPSAYPLLNFPVFGGENPVHVDSDTEDDELHSDVHIPVDKKVSPDGLLPLINVTCNSDDVSTRNNYLDSLVSKNMWPIGLEDSKPNFDSVPISRGENASSNGCRTSPAFCKKSQGLQEDSGYYNPDAGIEDYGYLNEQKVVLNEPRLAPPQERTNPPVFSQTPVHLATKCEPKTPVKNGYIPLSSLSNLSSNFNNVNSSPPSGMGNGSPRKAVDFPSSTPHCTPVAESTVQLPEDTKRTSLSDIFAADSLSDPADIMSLQLKSPVGRTNSDIVEEPSSAVRKVEMVPSKYLLRLDHVVDAETCEV